MNIIVRYCGLAKRAARTQAYEDKIRGIRNSKA
jgi:hypothetical protein